MGQSRNYDPHPTETRLQALWEQEALYHFSPQGSGAVYAIDAPPPTVSGRLHLGHVYSYSHADFIARFKRMQGLRVFYPLGFDDNGLPTERLVEKQLGSTAAEMGREAFIERCLEISAAIETEYIALWQRLGLSIDWRHTYRTIDPRSQQIAQWSFLDLYHQGRVYRQQAPVIWCPQCQTAIAQADVVDLPGRSTFYTLAFQLPNGDALPIATTRPELLPACVAIFVHPDDRRYADLVGTQARVPYTGQRVPILPDPQADPQKGTGAVMCCTFGDQTDVAWWRTHELPLQVILGKDGHLSEGAGELAGLTVSAARQQVIARLESQGQVLAQEPRELTRRAHERCDTPVEYIVSRQWFIRLLDCKDELLRAGEQVNWIPSHMAQRYHDWVQNLAWDWCISRQRTYGVPIPVWYCQACGEVALAIILALFAPFLPYITDELYRQLLATPDRADSVHQTRWPTPDPHLRDEFAEQVGETLVDIATAVRRFKSDHTLPLSTAFNRLQLATDNPRLAAALTEASDDLLSVTRARQIEVTHRPDSTLTVLSPGPPLAIAVEFTAGQAA